MAKCGNDCITDHTVYVYDRGGSRRLFQIPQVNLVRWGRVRDDISEATIRLSKQQCVDQAELLAGIRPLRHELVIYRNGRRVWEGPITLTTETRSGLEIDAKDVLYWAHKTVMHAGYSNAYPNIGFVVERARLILVTELARKEALDPPINVLPYLVDHQKPTDAQTSAVTVPYQYRVQEHLDNLAANSGLDYTAVGRAIHLWDTHESLGRTATATENDFLGDITVSQYGSQLTTFAHVTDGQGIVGSAGGIDPYFGEIEDLHTAYDEESNDAPPTSAEMTSQAQRNLAGKNPVPVILRVPDGSAVNPRGILREDVLIPGVQIPLRAELLTRTYTQLQKLDAMRCEETPEGEKIGVTLSPANIADEPQEE